MKKLSSNTRTRIVSGLLMAFTFLFLAFQGKAALYVCVLVCGLLLNDEVYCNFLKCKRFNFFYWVSQALLAFPFIYLNFFDQSSGLKLAVLNTGIVLNSLLLIYLFFMSFDKKKIPELGRRYPYLSGFYLMIQICCFTFFTHFESWKALLFLLLLVSSGMDVLAWFFGVNFGKHKLWEKVSPKKTIEGFVLGAISSGICATVFWSISFSFDEYKWWILLPLFCGLAILSQLGDLVQSKFKRQFEIKDSSSLIPGHGGMYDRSDSILFVAPFFGQSLLILIGFN